MKKSIFISSLPCLALVIACGGGKPSAKEPAAGDKSPLGGECNADADCSPGLSCDTGDPGGQCQKKCEAAAVRSMQHRSAAAVRRKVTLAKKASTFVGTRSTGASSEA